MMIDKIKYPNDIKRIKPKYLPALAKEIREFILDNVNKNGGHLASNLGDVELIMALHLSFDLPKDKIIFDVGHQSYTHKILTGRAEGFKNLRQIDGVSGFPSVSESDCDAFETGHATTSISAAYGMAKARDILGESFNVAAVIGDGAMTGGMAYEAINNAASLNSNMIIVLNDNNMSIGKNIGGMSKALTDIRLTKSYINAKNEIKRIFNDIPVIGKTLADSISAVKSSIKQLVLKGMIFEDMGITYVGPVDGHNINSMKQIFDETKSFKGCVLVHVITQKGRGFIDAIKNPDRFHSVSKGFLTNNKNFDIQKNEIIYNKKETYSDIFSKVLLEEAENNKKLVAITAAMTAGTGLTKFANKFSDRFFDVGIAEEHAITMAAGMSKIGLHPVVAIYSTFLQRSYDQLINDLGGMNLSATIILDRAGIVPNDGRTHQGIYDLSYLSTVPNLILLAPKNNIEFEMMLREAFNSEKLIAIRVPKGDTYKELNAVENIANKSDIFSSELIFESKLNNKKSVLLVPVGNMIATAFEVKDILSKNNIDCSIINPRIINPIDTEFIHKYAGINDLTVSMEENIKEGGFGQRLLGELNNLGFDKKFINISIDNIPYKTGSVKAIKNEILFTAEDISQKIFNALEKRYER